MGWELTQWGAQCQRIADEVTAAFPQFASVVDIWKGDDDARRDVGYLIKFLLRGRGRFAEPNRAGDLDTHPTFDEDAPIMVVITCPVDLDTSTNRDRSPALLERVVARALEAMDAIAHVPWFVPGTHERFGGGIGFDGSGAILECVCKLQYERTYFELSTATSTTTTFGVESPDGNGGSTVESVEVAGDAP